ADFFLNDSMRLYRSSLSERSSATPLGMLYQSLSNFVKSICSESKAAAVNTALTPVSFAAPCVPALLPVHDSCSGLRSGTKRNSSDVMPAISTGDLKIRRSELGSVKPVR